MKARVGQQRSTGSRLLGILESISAGAGCLAHIESIDERKPRYGEPAAPVPERVRTALSSLGIERFYTHQARALDLVRSGANVVVATGTASGKSLCYQVPILESLLQDPGATALLVFPTKALAQDQLRSFARLIERTRLPGEALIGTYDGDTPPRRRSSLREKARVILTNPEMLHSGILPHHARWARFFSQMAFVVCDEIHTYRGVFGSNVANVLRRMRRILSHYGGSPRYVFCSATIANPAELSSALTGLPFEEVAEDGSPRGRRHFVFWNPPVIDRATMQRASAAREASRIMARLVSEGYQSIAFVKARQATEVLLRSVRDALERKGGGLMGRVRSYRGGYLPEERREIERQLFEGHLLGVVATNALELGIDVGSLDAALLVGYPGTIASTWQRAGRAGRRDAESVAVLIGQSRPIDQYLMRHPEYFFSKSPESAVVDPQNPYVLMGHLRAAVFELPYSPEDDRYFGEYARSILALLEETGEVKRIGERFYYASMGYPAAQVSLRTIGESVYLVVDTSAAAGDEGADVKEQALSRHLLRGRSVKGRVVGTADEAMAYAQLHPGAIYLHESGMFHVDDLDLNEKVAYAHRVELDYYTQSTSDTRIHIAAVEDERPVLAARAGFGSAQVREKVFLYKKIRFGTNESIGFGSIDLPPRVLETDACWFVPPDSAVSLVRSYGIPLEDALGGIANALLDVLKLYAMCEPSDIGATVDSRPGGVTAVFLYDKYQGGLGFAQRAYKSMESLLEACCDLIGGCPCEEGCPSCVGAPLVLPQGIEADVSFRGRIPSKDGALVVLHEILGREPYVPRKRGRRAQESTEAASGQQREVPKPKPLPPEVEARLRRSLGRSARGDEASPC